MGKHHMKKYGLFCGIDHYEELDDLNCAVRDAGRMEYLFDFVLGYKIQPLYNDKCTLRVVSDRLRKLGKELDDGDTFIFYFAGHGVVEHEDDYYCLHGAETSCLKSGDHAGDDVLSYRVLRRITDEWPKGVLKVFILDACRHQANRAEAQNRAPSPAYYNDPKHDLKPYLKGPKIDPETMGILMSCQTGQGAQELCSEGYGLLVGAFNVVITDLKKLGKPLVLDDELKRNLEKEMNKLGRKHKLNEQTPWLYPDIVNLKLGGGVEDYHDQRTREALVAEFDDHLAAGRLDKPYNRCCTSVLTKLLALNFDRPQYEALDDRLQTALNEHELASLSAQQQQLFEAAAFVDTLIGWQHFLGECKLPQLKDQAKAAIIRIKEEKEKQKSGDVAAQKLAEEQRRRDEEYRKAEALREQAERDAAEAERKKKAAEEARLAKLVEEEIVRRQQAEAEEQARIMQAAQRAEEARLAKEKQLQEAEARRKREEAETNARREAAEKAEREAKEVAAQRAREEAEAKRQQEAAKRQQSDDEKAWQETIRFVEVCADLNNKKVAYESYANRWSLHRVESLARVDELKEKIRQAADVALEQEKEAQRLKAEQDKRKAAEAKRKQDAAGKTGDVKKGKPGWAWGLAIVVPLVVAVAIGLSAGEEKINFAPRPTSVQKAVSAYAGAESLQASWTAMPYGNPDRVRHLDRLLGLANQLSLDEKTKLLASISQRYQSDSSIRPKDGTAAQSWLNETEKLASAGVKSARFELGSALLTGKNPDTRRAGSLYSQVLQGVTAQTLHEDEKMTNAILKAVGRIALIADDRAFAEAITPGLTQLALLGAPDAAFYLANLMVCRANPPRLDDARNYLNIAAQSSEWNALALDRLKTVQHMELCDFIKRK